MSDNNCPDTETALIPDEVKHCVQIARIEYVALGHLLDALECESYCARPGLAEEAITMAAVLRDHVADIANQLIMEDEDDDYVAALERVVEEARERVKHLDVLRGN